jgi:tetratricopeptide (TPR) repeat protein
MSKKQSRQQGHLNFFFAFIIITPILMCGCSHSRSAFKEANDFLSQGNYRASLSKYEQIIAQYPTVGDRVLFEMGVIYAFPRNQQKDYQKSLECFQKLIKDYPGSEYRQDSEVMVSLINDVTSKDKSIITQQKEIETLEQEVINKGKGVITKQDQIDTLEQEVISKGKRTIAEQKKEIETLDQQIISKGDRIYTQQKQIEMLEQQIRSKGDKIIAQQEQIEMLQKQVKELEKKIGQLKEVDMYIKEKKKLSP